MSKPAKFILASGISLVMLACLIFAPFMVLAYRFTLIEDEMREEC